MENKKSIPSLKDILGSTMDKEKSKYWSEFAKTRVEWGTEKNYRESMASFCIAFDFVKVQYGSDVALFLFQLITDDKALLPNEIIKAGKYLHDGGAKAEVMTLAEEGYFIDDFGKYNSSELSVEYQRNSYVAANAKDGRSVREHQPMVPVRDTGHDRKMDKERLLKIGNDVASLWGGSCHNFKINRKEKKVVFDCIEHGEKFATSLSFSEIKEKYGIELSKKQPEQKR
jgi:hypothetical protein